MGWSRLFKDSWAILYSLEINVFADSYSNGGQVVSGSEGGENSFLSTHVEPGRSSAADTPPSAPVGTVRHVPQAVCAPNTNRTPVKPAGSNDSAS